MVSKRRVRVQVYLASSNSNHNNSLPTHLEVLVSIPISFENNSFSILLGNATANAAKPSLFAQPTQPTTTFGGFGTQPQQNQAAQPGTQAAGSLFGGGLFGQNQQAQQQQPQQPAGTGRKSLDIPLNVVYTKLIISSVWWPTANTANSWQ